MKCWKCSKEVQNGASKCLYCGADQKRPDPVTEIGRAMRQLYDLYGADRALADLRILINGIGDYVENTGKIRLHLAAASEAHVGKMYLEQIQAKGASEPAFRKKIARILSEDAELSDKAVAELMDFFDEMIGWPVIGKTAKPKPEPAEPDLADIPEEELHRPVKTVPEQKPAAPKKPKWPIIIIALLVIAAAFLVANQSQGWIPVPWATPTPSPTATPTPKPPTPEPETPTPEPKTPTPEPVTPTPEPETPTPEPVTPTPEPETPTPEPITPTPEPETPTPEPENTPTPVPSASRCEWDEQMKTYRVYNDYADEEGVWDLLIRYGGCDAMHYSPEEDRYIIDSQQIVWWPYNSSLTLSNIKSGVLIPNKYLIPGEKFGVGFTRGGYSPIINVPNGMNITVPISSSASTIKLKESYIDHVTVEMMERVDAALNQNTASAAKARAVIASEFQASVALSSKDNAIHEMRVKITPPDGNYVSNETVTFVDGNVVDLGYLIYIGCMNSRNIQGKIQTGLYSIDLYDWEEMAYIGRIGFTVDE